MPPLGAAVGSNDNFDGFANIISEVDRAGCPVSVLNITDCLEAVNGIGTLQLNIVSAARQLPAVVIEDLNVETRFLVWFVVASPALPAAGIL